ncbi:hypothetical protein CP556_23905 [Natrinema sp. CBA1119]|nr:hypothetical protein CP556_23905 [Natrinema sp. CBA1119]
MMADFLVVIAGLFLGWPSLFYCVGKSSIWGSYLLSLPSAVQIRSEKRGGQNYRCPCPNSVAATALVAVFNWILWSERRHRAS